MNLWSSSTAKRCRGGGASPSNPQEARADTLASSPTGHTATQHIANQLKDGGCPVGVVTTSVTQVTSSGPDATN